MGDVYRVLDTRLGRRIAIKVLPSRLAADPDFCQRFEREARAASRLADPRICTVHDIGRHDDTAYLVMELVEGDTLAQWLRRSPRPAVDDVIDKALQVARALVVAHDAGVVHRDIKPENVIIRADGSVKVLDFGVAKIIERPDENAATMPPGTAAGLIVGTTKYMSPEQARGGAVDGRSDLFSLGVVLYEMLSGQSPFEAATVTDTLIAILQREPEAITRHRPECGSGLQRVLETCLAKQAERRYPSARALVAELEALMSGHWQPGPPALPSIAVLPFVNMSADPDNEYFCDGIAEDLISALTKIEQLRVAARTSAFAFKGRQADLREVGRALGVSSVLEGSVRRAGSRLRITAQLVNAADGYQVWSERYDRQLEDVFAIQDEISLAIVEAMKVRLLGGEKAALVKRHTENVEAFHLYLRGRHHWQSWSPDGFAKATVYMQQAALSDPNYPLPQVGLADITIASATIGVAPYSELVPKARAHVARALALDPDLDMAWTIASIVHFHAWEMTAARQAAGKAIALNRRLAHAHAAAACAYLGEGDGARGLAPARRAVELEPLSPQWNYILGLMHLIRDEPQPAYEVAQSMLDVIPQAWTAHHVQGNVHYGAGRYEAAVRAFAEAARYSGDSPIALGALSSALAANGDRDRAEQILADLVARYEHGFCLALPMAIASAGLGRIDDAFIWLERSIAQTDIWLRTAWWNPVCRALRDDPRMLDLMRRVRIEPH